MKKKFIDIFDCPYCNKESLSLRIIAEDKEQIKEGLFNCRLCNRKFPIKDSVPNFLPDSFKAENKVETGHFSYDGGFLYKLLSKFTTNNGIIINGEGSDVVVLDIGCGLTPRGSINMDVFYPPKLPNNFILASADLLPFKANSIDIIVSAYVIEHLISPSDFIKSAARIARKKSIIITDNSEWIGDYFFRIIQKGRLFHHEHCYRWSIEYLNNLILRLGFECETRLADFSPTFFVHVFSCLGKIPYIGNFFYRDLVAEIFNTNSLHDKQEHL
ncbi:MAG: methyltransferase domain-containing protein [Thermodesulfobacteriota bacterium]